MKISLRNTTKTTGSPKQYRFRKEERITGRKSISSLFDSGRRIDGYPLRIIFGPGEEAEFPLKMAVSVPKRLFKRAIDRNLLKRRIREAYRLQKSEFYEFINQAGIRIRLVVQYRGEEIEAYPVIEKKLQEILEKLKKKLSGEFT